MKTSILSDRFYILAFILIFPFIAETSGQEYYIRVYFRDKGDHPAYNVSDLFSERAIARREKAGLNSLDNRDIPVNETYLSAIKSLGFIQHCTSRWMNTALFKVTGTPAISSLTALAFVSEVRIVKTPGIKSRFRDKLDFKTSQVNQSPFDRPLTMLNGQSLHSTGYKGENVIIAVLDGGFTSADKIESLNSLRARNGIISTRSFINNTDFVYNSSTHGTAVLSILAGTMPGYIAGTAPSAKYILLKTEDVDSEFPCEEDFWVAGAEYADSAGADIISSSLGYYQFDDPSMDYKHQDLDGNTAFVTKAADIAASRGILAISSAGNERDNTWQKIICPSDGDSVLSVGAVDENKIIAAFSSSGPAADGRVKPDVTAMGVQVPLQTIAGYISRANGTSFSCPVISGMTACLIQAIPQATNYAIIKALHEGADRYTNPDPLYGFGIPDMNAVLRRLQSQFPVLPSGGFSVHPNPTTGAFEIIFKDIPGTFTLEIFTITGKLVYSNVFPAITGRTITLDVLQNREQGMYIIKFSNESGTYTGKVLKIRE